MNAASASSNSKLTRAAINKNNSQKSTGPKTAAGKTRSSLNAVKTGLTGRTVLLPSDDADAYRNHVNAYIAEFAPVGLRESALVQSLADYAWRLDRLVMLEMGIYAVGHAHFAEKFDNHRKVIQVRAHLAFEKQLRNLHIQEGRLRRYREKDMVELNQLQEIRRAAETTRQTQGARLRASYSEQVAAEQGNRDAKRAEKSTTYSESGFEFSNAASNLHIAVAPRSQADPKTPKSGVNVRLSPGASANAR